MCRKRFKNCAPLCLAVLLAGPLASIAHADTSPFAPPTHAHASAALTSVNEYGRLQKQNSNGASVNEKGIGWGSFNCSVLIELTLSGTLVTAEYTTYLQGGSISGTARAQIHSATTTAAYFSGTITLRRGTGTRAHASGTASFSGTINRTTYAMTTHITGKLRL